MIDTYELIARPAAGVVSPTLHAAELYIEDPGPISTSTSASCACPAIPSRPPGCRRWAPAAGRRLAVAGAEVTMTTILTTARA
jgi:hypothetical protein